MKKKNISYKMIKSYRIKTVNCKKVLNSKFEKKHCHLYLCVISNKICFNSQ